MSFFGLFENKLSDRSQIHFDLAKIHLDKGNYLQALDTLDQIEAAEQESSAVKALRERIHEELDTSVDGESEATQVVEFESTEMSGDRFVIQMSDFDQEGIQEYTDKGYFVESCCYGDQWVIVFRTPDEEQSAQEYMLLETFEEDSFQEYHASGYYITQVASDGDLWFFVLEQREGWLDQFWIASPGEIPKEEWKDWESQGYFINTMLMANDIYFGTAVQLEEPVELESSMNTEDPTEKIASIWNEDKWLIRFFELGEKLLYYYTDKTDISDQGCALGNELPLQDLEERFKDDHHLAQLCFTDYGWVAVTQKKKS